MANTDKPRSSQRPFSVEVALADADGFDDPFVADIRTQRGGYYEFSNGRRIRGTPPKAPEPEQP